ncbi:hypothetical protein ACFQI3_10400 [Hansschlegelia quercus]|uniref:hypothetical protein n=1 Tax=Hansschlegelia quercus TaxID=2528245 RepID=UPI0013EEF1F5|nr:hypothetical protein [Hansschlegelia quercus]
MSSSPREELDPPVDGSSSDFGAGVVVTEITLPLASVTVVVTEPSAAVSVVVVVSDEDEEFELTEDSRLAAADPPPMALTLMDVVPGRVFQKSMPNGL